VRIGVDNLVRMHILAQQHESLPKALACLLIGTVAPQQAGEMFATGRLLGTQREDRQQGADFPGGKGYRRTTRFVMPGGNFAENTQHEPARWHHLLRPTHCGAVAAMHQSPI
jgi:hypothetical protein